jgi:hypothetical protein
VCPVRKGISGKPTLTSQNVDDTRSDSGIAKKVNESRVLGWIHQRIQWATHRHLKP